MVYYASIVNYWEIRLTSEDKIDSIDPNKKTSKQTQSQTHKLHSADAQH